MAQNKPKPTLIKTNVPQADVTLGRPTPPPSNTLKPNNSKPAKK